MCEDMHNSKIKFICRLELVIFLFVLRKCFCRFGVGFRFRDVGLRCWVFLSCGYEIIKGFEECRRDDWSFRKRNFEILFRKN